MEGESPKEEETPQPVFNPITETENIKNYIQNSEKSKKRLYKSSVLCYNIQVVSETTKKLGCRQAVRQRTLTPLFRGFKSFHPNQRLLHKLQKPFLQHDD